MNPKSTPLAASLLLFLLQSFATVCAAPKTVLAHYMPWFVSQPYSGTWGWHWTMNNFNPNTTNARGQREIASWYYPQIGPYDSLDPAVLEYHVLLMKLAGIDGVVVDWYGMDDHLDYSANNQRTLALLQWTRKAGLKFSLCYEDRAIQREVADGYITAAAALARAQQTMLYAQSNFFEDPACLRFSGQPVLLNFGPQYFHGSAEWTAIFSVLNAGNVPAFFTEDDRLAPAAVGAFDWPPMSRSGPVSQSTSDPALTDTAMESYLTEFDQKAAAWPAFISSAFPRFHDIYAQAGPEPTRGHLDDQNGATFQNTLRRAMTNAAPFVQVVTWNDFGEGTVVEPTLQYGYRDLGVIQSMRRQYLDPDFSFRTNDLQLPLRLYNMRKKYAATNALLSAEMDRVFSNIISNDLSDARLQLNGLEAGEPVIYGASYATLEAQFLIGGFISRYGVQVLQSPRSHPYNWQSVTLVPVGTNLTSFSYPFPPDFPETFLKVESSPRPDAPEKTH